uniref:Uncharacterized protein n=1 Tax=Plectus sambesii TaxID=2011161 RepID=A0A914V107_9BILA
MSAGYTYSMEPIKGREALQRNFVSVAQKGESYSNRRVSLNERFSLLNRGYLLRPQLDTLPKPFANVSTKLVPLRKDEPELKTDDKQAVNGNEKFSPHKQPITAIPAAFADDKDDGWD